MFNWMRVTSWRTLCAVVVVGLPAAWTILNQIEDTSGSFRRYQHDRDNGTAPWPMTARLEPVRDSLVVGRTYRYVGNPSEPQQGPSQLERNGQVSYVLAPIVVTPISDSPWLLMDLRDEATLEAWLGGRKWEDLERFGNGLAIGRERRP